MDGGGCFSDAISWLFSDIKRREAFSPLEVDMKARNKACDQRKERELCWDDSATNAVYHRLITLSMSVKFLITIFHMASII